MPIKIFFACSVVWLTSSLSQLSAATVILQYHHISNSTPPSTSLAPALFRQHLEYLSEHGYQVLAMPDVIVQLKQGKTLPDRSVVITFDDAYDSVYTTAFPLLRARQWPFTVFVSTGALQQNLSGFTSWEQLREMAKVGATIANHSHSHSHFLRRLSDENPSQWRARIHQDIVQAEGLIKKHTDQQHGMLAYPYGEYNLALKDIVRDLGYVAFGQQSGPVPANLSFGTVDLLALPRFPLGGNYGGLDDFAVKVATLAMPIKSVVVLGSDGVRLEDTLLPRQQAQPELIIELEQAATGAIQCFASGQGATDLAVVGTRIRAQAKRPLPVGRSRYNCTAASGEPGRFYWYSHFFIRKQVNGEWYPER